MLLSSLSNCFILPSYSKELDGNSAFKFSFSILQTQRKDDLILQPHLKQIGKEWEESNTTRNTEQFVMRKGRTENLPGLGKSFDVFWRLGSPFESSFNLIISFCFQYTVHLDAKPGFRF